MCVWVQIVICNFKSSVCGEQTVRRQERENLGICYGSPGLKSMVAWIRDLVVEVKVSGGLEVYFGECANALNVGR